MERQYTHLQPHPNNSAPVCGNENRTAEADQLTTGLKITTDAQKQIKARTAEAAD